MKKERINITYIIMYIALVAFFMILFKTIGLRIVFGLTLLVLPFALLLRKFKLPLEEILIYSLFLALTFFPVFVYYAGIVIGSIRLAMLIVFVVLLILGVIINLKRVNKDENKS